MSSDKHIGEAVFYLGIALHCAYAKHAGSNRDWVNACEESVAEGCNPPPPPSCSHWAALSVEGTHDINLTAISDCINRVDDSFIRLFWHDFGAEIENSGNEVMVWARRHYQRAIASIHDTCRVW